MKPEYFHKLIVWATVKTLNNFLGYSPQPPRMIFSGKCWYQIAMSLQRSHASLIPHPHPALMTIWLKQSRHTFMDFSLDMRSLILMLWKPSLFNITQVYDCNTVFALTDRSLVFVRINVKVCQNTTLSVLELSVLAFIQTSRVSRLFYLLYEFKYLNFCRKLAKCLVWKIFKTRFLEFSSLMSALSCTVLQLFCSK